MNLLGYFTAAIRAFFRRLFEEVLAEHEMKQAQLSRISFGTSHHMLQIFSLTVEDLPRVSFNFPPAQRYAVFNWGRDSEKAGTPRACAHLQGQLARAGVQLVRGSFQLYDVHGQNDLLSIQLRHLKISGTTDLIVAPHGTNQVSLLSNACVVVELKTSSAMGGAVSDTVDRQAYGELICARILSRQPDVMVIVTDLVSVSKCYEFVYIPATNILKIAATEMSMDGMIRKVRDFLANTAESVPGFNVKRLPSSQPGANLRAKDAGAMEFFNNLLPGADNDPDDRMIELLDDDDVAIRAAALRQLYQSADLPLPPLLQGSENNYSNMSI